MSIMSPHKPTAVSVQEEDDAEGMRHAALGVWRGMREAALLRPPYGVRERPHEGDSWRLPSDWPQTLSMWKNRYV